MRFFHFDIYYYFLISFNIVCISKDCAFYSTRRYKEYLCPALSYHLQFFLRLTTVDGVYKKEKYGFLVTLNACFGNRFSVEFLNFPLLNHPPA